MSTRNLFVLIKEYFWAKHKFRYNFFCIFPFSHKFNALLFQAFSVSHKTQKHEVIKWFKIFEVDCLDLVFFMRLKVIIYLQSTRQQNESFKISQQCVFSEERIKVKQNVLIEIKIDLEKKLYTFSQSEIWTAFWFIVDNIFWCVISYVRRTNCLQNNLFLSAVRKN